MRQILIVAADLDDCIGKENEIPWRIPSDIKRFKELTMSHDVIMGRVTSQSIIDRLGSPLPGRCSRVLVRQQLEFEGECVEDIYLYSSPEAVIDSLALSKTFNPDQEVFVIGGAQIYGAFLGLGLVDRILLTRVHTRVKDGDTFMPQNWLGGFMQTEAEPAFMRDPRDEFPTSYTTYERYGSRHG